MFLIARNFGPIGPSNGEFATCRSPMSGGKAPPPERAHPYNGPDRSCRNWGLNE